MNRVSFITKPLGPLVPPYREDHITFSAVSLEVGDDATGLHGLAFTGSRLDIEFELAESVLIDLIVQNPPTEIRALDGGGVSVATPLFYTSAGVVAARFSVGSPIIRRVEILGGQYEALLLQVIISR